MDKHLKNLPEYQVFQAKYGKGGGLIKPREKLTPEELLKQYAKQLKISLPKLDQTTLIRRSVGYYNFLNRKRGIQRYASSSSDEAFLKRICVNFLRHRHTTYDKILHEGLKCKKLDENALVIKLSNKVLDAIAKSYPWLAEECINQRTAKVEATKLLEEMLASGEWEDELEELLAEDELDDIT